MTQPLSLSARGFGPADGDQPDSLVVFLHGYGADGNDLLGLAPEWAGGLPRTMFVSPNAPFPCEASPLGYQWFGFENRDAETLLAGACAAATMLDAFLDDLLKAHGLPANRLALVGFSQGTMMALHVAPRRAEALAGIVGYSGALLAPERLAGEGRSRPPVLLIHGDADPVVPYGALAAAAAGLAAAGIPVTAETRPGLPHAIDPVGLALGLRFLRRVLAAGAGG